MQVPFGSAELEVFHLHRSEIPCNLHVRITFLLSIASRHSTTCQLPLMSSYDSSNIFARILRGELPSYKIFETEHALAILDAFPLVRGHCLLLPKGEYKDVIGERERCMRRRTIGLTCV